MMCVLFAVLSAVLYGTGVAFEHRQAATTAASAAGRPRLVLLLMRQPVWWGGAMCEVSGFAAHTAALNNGSLAVVQLLLSGSLIVSIAVSGVLQRRRLTGRSWLAVSAVVIGIGGSVALLGTDAHDPGADTCGRLVVAAVVSGLVAVPVTVAAFTTRGRRRPLLLGCAAGLADAVIAVITMAFAQQATHGVATVVTTWPIYALIAGGLASLVVTQTAYQADRPLVTLPVIATVMPVASVAIDVGVLGGTAQLSGTRCLALVLCVQIAVLGLITLARAGAATTRRDEEPRCPTREGPLCVASGGVEDHF